MVRTVVTKKNLYTDRAGEKFIVGIVRDITDLRQAEVRARQHQEQLVHVARVSTIGEMASGLADEVTEPLWGKLLLCQDAAANLKTGTWDHAQAREYLQKIAAQAERAGEFVRRLKAFVRRAEPYRERTYIYSIVRECFSNT